MPELKLVAVGSSPLIAAEIQSIAQSFLGDVLPLSAARTHAVEQAAPDAFYLCAVTQEKALAAVLPAGQLFLLDLHPTTKFFLDIARIPKGADVYVFNNLLPYTELLAEECRALGIDGISFHSIAYEEMPDSEVRARLRAARYIIGVDRLVGSDMLFSDSYRSCLRADVRIIPGRRAASVASAGRLLAGIAAFYHTRLETLQGSDSPSSELLAESGRIIHMLRHAAAQALASQVGAAMPTLPPKKAATPPLPLAEQLPLLAYLEQKLRKLGD